MRFLSHVERDMHDGSRLINFDLIDNCSEMTQEILNNWKNDAEEIRSLVPGFASHATISDLVKYFGILKSNSYMMRSKETGECFGGQLIEVHSRINHSCEPNCVSSHDGTNVFLISLREIKAGEEVIFFIFII